MATGVLGAGRFRPTMEADRPIDRPPVRRRWPLTAGGMVGLAIVAGLVSLAIAGPWLPVADADQQELRARLEPPVWAGGSWTYPLGTDQLGRDLLARIVAGARASLAIGLFVSLLSGAVGIALGLLAGVRGPLIDRLIRFMVDVQLALPVVVLAIAVTALRGPSTGGVIAVLVASGWVAYQRVVRVQVRLLRQATFVEAAQVVGGSRWRIATTHMLPNASGPIVMLATQQVAAVMLFEASLTYLGVGAPSDVLTWGGMIADGREVLFTAWWVSTLPGAAIAVAVLGFNLLGDGVAPRLRPVRRTHRHLLSGPWIRGQRTRRPWRVKT